MMRLLLFLVVPALLLAAAVVLGPIAQAPAYHGFADQRGFYSIPNFTNVVSNFAFLLFGYIGLRVCMKRQPDGALAAWTFFFLAFIAVGFGSAYYHWAPSSSSLVVDRMAMVLAFAGFYVALLSEYVDERVEKAVLLPATLAGVASVLYWDWSGDLSPYFAFQGTVVVSALIVLVGFRSLFPQKGLILWALVLYGAAVALEQYDHQILALTRGATGGHAAKHLFAALAAVPLAVMLSRRPPVPDRAAVDHAIADAAQGAEARGRAGEA